MPVQLDWEIDNVEAPLPDAEMETRRRLEGCRRWWRPAALAAMVVAIGLGFLTGKIHQNEKELENELRAVAELELTALNNGDRDLYLNLQDSGDRRWRRTQEDAFNNYHVYAERAPWEDTPQILQYTGEVPLVSVRGDEGWAQVEVTRGQQAWWDLWFYQWTQADGWRHVRFDKDWLGEEQVLTTPHLCFSFPEADAVTATALAHEMEGWYDILAPLFGVPAASEFVLTVQFSYRAPGSPGLQSQWASDSVTLEAPSLHQSPLSANGEPALELRTQMASYLAEALIAFKTSRHPNENLGPTVNALRAELRDWAVARIGQSLSDQTLWTIAPTPLVDALVARQGAQSMAPLVAVVNQPQNLDQALAAAGLDPPDPFTRMAFHVAAVNRAYQELDETSFRGLLDPQSNRAWREDQTSRLRWRLQNAQAGHLWPAPSSLQVTSVVFDGSIAWVEVESTTNDDATYRQVYFFRQVGEQWLLTAPDPAFFGERRVARTENLVFDYYERDAAWFEGRISGQMQAVFSQAAADLGISTDRLVITIETEIQLGAGVGPSGNPNLLRFISPSITGWRVDQPEDQMLQIAVELIGVLFQTRLQTAPEEDSRYFLANIGAFVWELERLFPKQIDWDTWLGFRTEHEPIPSLTDLWSRPALEPADEDSRRFLAGYRALFGFLTETYGPEVAPKLLDNLLLTDDLGEWLQLSTGHGLDEVEPAWRVWVSAAGGG